MTVLNKVKIFSGVDDNGIKEISMNTIGGYVNLSNEEVIELVKILLLEARTGITILDGEETHRIDPYAELELRNRIRKLEDIMKHIKEDIEGVL